MRDFEILTLSDHNLGKYRGLRDPVSIITGGVALLQGIFPSLFGGGRRKLTSADWIMMFPGSGAWTVRLRNRLSETIHYDSDLQNIEPFTRYFVDDNKLAICGPGVSFNECYSIFLGIIEQEKFTGGKFPIGVVPGLTRGLDYASILPFAIGGIILVFLLRKKK